MNPDSCPLTATAPTLSRRAPSSFPATPLQHDGRPARSPESALHRAVLHATAA